MVFWREDVFYMCLLSFASIWSVKYAQFFYTDVALLWYSPEREWFLYQTLLRVSHLIIHYRIVSSEIYWPNKDRNCGKHLGTGAAAPSANTCSSLLCVAYDFTDLMWSEFRKHETCRVEQPDFSVVTLQAFMKDKVNQFSNYMVLKTCQISLLLWDTNISIWFTTTKIKFSQVVWWFDLVFSPMVKSKDSGLPWLLSLQLKCLLCCWQRL